MEDKNQNNSCLDCKYYKKLYVKDNTKFRLYGTGVCCNYNFRLTERRKSFPYRVACELWELKEDSEEEKKEAIEEVIRGTSKTLNQILEILQSE